MADAREGAGRRAGPVFRVLGALDITADADLAPLPPGRHQIVLSALLIEANRVVRIDQLIDAIWYDDPPATARTQVQICVSGLRQHLAPLGDDVAIVTRAPGYLLRVPRELVDAHLFTDLVGEADGLARTGHRSAAADRIGGALDLWRGAALTGTSSRVLQARAAQLDEKRLNAVEALADLELQLDRHHHVIDSHGALVDEHPLRERLRGQLMLALYRAGRQADALRVYRDGRELLVEQLGLEPGEELRKLERAILAGDPALRPEAPAPVAAPRPAPSPVDEPPAEIPDLRPPDLPDFTAREDLAAAVAEALARPGAVTILTGKPGVGKTSLAVYAAHHAGPRSFPDGHLYADLGGTRTEAVTAIDVLDGFLRALGVPGEAIPDGLEARVHAYRRLVKGRDLLVVLDDAADDAQVAALLPHAAAGAALVTTRTRLTAQPRATVIEVEVMTADQSLRLLSAVIGDERVAAEPAAADALIRLVGGLPLALRVVAARLAARPHWSLAWMRERLADERRRLDELAHGSLMVRASLALSYDGLEPGARRLLRLLSGVDAVTFPIWVGAALLELDLFGAADLLEVLVDVQLLEIAAPDLNGSPRYKFHEIIRLFAREQLELNESAQSRAEEFARVGDGWLALAREAHRRIYGGDYTTVIGRIPALCPPPTYTAQVLTDPLRWLEAERANLCAVVAQAARTGAHELAWSLALALVALFETRCYYEDWERTHALALEAVRAAGDRRGDAALLCSIGSLHLSRSRFDEAEAAITPALAGFLELGDVAGIALARRNLGLLHQLRREDEAALGQYRQALAGFEQTGDPIGQAHILSQQAQIALRGDAYEEAAGLLHRALGLSQGVGNRRVEVQVRYRLSGLMLSQGRHADAEDLLNGLLELVRATGDVVGQGRILHRLGVLSAELGRIPEARRLLREALALQQQVYDRRGVGEIRAALAKLAVDLGEPDPALL
ncbi:AfsR/SARP family transcriptional regulator [Hamadaea tsunoensis]|uniref:AfsR/SARP family transcriptional regulator n=1 Tax=Hamadaea tsunoensis TaxID=53368 RepID=UPI0004222340|nr:BTAD domain-containing putative transcriptional regulator [Hamadaea tsunoensis]